MFYLNILFLSLLIILSSCSRENSTPTGKKDDSPVDIFELNQRIGRGINLGNALEAPNEGDWGVTLDYTYFKIIRDAGFNSIRLPVRWSAHAAADSPYTIDPIFKLRVDWAINQAIGKNLIIIVNMHHYEEMFSAPGFEKKRFLGLWRQLAESYKDYSWRLVFEILNEPHDALTDNLWNQYLAEALDLIRESNPNRGVIIGTAGWGGAGSLDQLIIPEADTAVIVTYHYYNPFEFTHQGAEWVDGSDSWIGTVWTGSDAEKLAIGTEFNKVQSWSVKNNRPIFMGEFGAYSRADLNSRALWTAFAAREAEARNFSWAYWEFCSGFGAYNTVIGAWLPDLLDALIPPKE